MSLATILEQHFKWFGPGKSIHGPPSSSLSLWAPARGKLMLKRQRLALEKVLWALVTRHPSRCLPTRSSLCTEVVSENINLIMSHTTSPWVCMAWHVWSLACLAFRCCPSAPATPFSAFNLSAPSHHRPLHMDFAHNPFSSFICLRTGHEEVPVHSGFLFQP